MSWEMNLNKICKENVNVDLIWKSVPRLKKELNFADDWTNLLSEIMQMDYANTAYLVGQ